MNFLKKISFTYYGLSAGATYPVSVWDGDSGSRDSDNNNVRAPDAKDWLRLVNEVSAIQTQLGLQAAAEQGVVGSSTVEVTDLTGVQRTVLTLTDVAITIGEGGTKEFGSALIFTFPQGAIKLLGVTINLTAVATVNFSGTGAGDYALGIIAATDRDLTGDDVIWTTDSAAMTVTTVASNLHDQGELIAIHDNTGGAAGKVYLNLILDNGESTGTITVNGTITLIWANLGDY